MNEYYETNEEFKAYVDNYAKSNNITAEEALKHKLIQIFYEYLLSSKGGEG